RVAYQIGHSARICFDGENLAGWSDQTAGQHAEVSDIGSSIDERATWLEEAPQSGCHVRFILVHPRPEGMSETVSLLQQQHPAGGQAVAQRCRGSQLPVD